MIKYFPILSRTKEKIKTYLTVCVRVRVCVCVCSLYYFPHVSIYPFLFSFCMHCLICKVGDMQLLQ